MNRYLDWLGYKVRDKVSGFEGIADSVCFDLYGCVQCSVMPEYRADEKETRPGRWYDIKRLVKVSDVRVMEPPTEWYDQYKEVGPADKAPRPW